MSVTTKRKLWYYRTAPNGEPTKARQEVRGLDDYSVMAWRSEDVKRLGRHLRAWRGNKMTT